MLKSFQTLSLCVVASYLIGSGDKSSMQGPNFFMKKEIWKDVVGYEGLYSVSNKGRVKSLFYTYFKTNIANGIMTPINSGGYDAVNLYKNRVRKLTKVHRIVATAFVNNHNKKYLTQVNHIDSNKYNNSSANLEWVSNRENSCHKFIGKKTSSAFTGVCWCKKRKKFRAYICFNGKQKHIGLFDTDIEAFEAYKKECKVLFIENRYTTK